MELTSCHFCQRFFPLIIGSMLYFLIPSDAGVLTKQTIKDPSSLTSSSSCFSQSRLDLPLSPLAPQFSNHSFIYDEKGLDSSYLTTPPEPAPPFPYEKQSRLSFSNKNVNKYLSSRSISSDSLHDPKTLVEMGLQSGTTRTVLAPSVGSNSSRRSTSSIYSTLGSYDKGTLHQMIRNSNINIKSFNNSEEVPIVSSILTVKPQTTSIPLVDDRRESCVWRR